MAKKSSISVAQEALISYGTIGTLEKGMFEFTHTYKGKIKKLSFIPHNHGVSETVTIVFPDNSDIKVTKFIKPDGTTKVSLKIV